MLTNVLPWTPVELAKQFLILLLEIAKFWRIDLLIDVEIEKESESEDLEGYLEIGNLEIKKLEGCSEPFNFRKLLSREQELSAIILKVEDLLTLGLSCSFKSSVKLRKHYLQISLASKNDV